MSREIISENSLIDLNLLAIKVKLEEIKNHKNKCSSYQINLLNSQLNHCKTKILNEHEEMNKATIEQVAHSLILNIENPYDMNLFYETLHKLEKINVWIKELNEIDAQE